MKRILKDGVYLHDQHIYCRCSNVCNSIADNLKSANIPYSTNIVGGEYVVYILNRRNHNRYYFNEDNNYIYIYEAKNSKKSGC